MSIAENIAAIRARIDAAAREVGRSGDDIILVGASKMNDAAVGFRNLIAKFKSMFNDPAGMKIVVPVRKILRKLFFYKNLCTMY